MRQPTKTKIKKMIIKLIKSYYKNSVKITFCKSFFKDLKGVNRLNTTGNNKKKIIINIIKILNLIIKLLSLGSIIDNIFTDFLFINEDQGKTVSNVKKVDHEYNIGKLVGKFIIGIAIIA